MAKLNIPPEVRPALVELASANPDHVRRLLDVLARAEPRQAVNKFIETVTAQASIAGEWNAETAVYALMSLAAGRQQAGLTIDEFIEGITESTELGLPDSNRQQLAEIVKVGLANDALTVTAKAWELLIENQTNFKQARVVTDVRPIFSDADAPPSAALVVHSLRLTYWDKGGDHDFWLAMDDDDIEDLRRAVSRAQVKSKQLRSSLHDGPLRLLPQERL